MGVIISMIERVREMLGCCLRRFLFPGKFQGAQQKREQESYQGNDRHDTVKDDGTVCLVEGAADECANRAAQAQLERAAHRLSGGADAFGRALVDISDAAGVLEGEAATTENREGDRPGGLPDLRRGSECGGKGIP